MKIFVYAYLDVRSRELIRERQPWPSSSTSIWLAHSSLSVDSATWSSGASTS